MRVIAIVVMLILLPVSALAQTAEEHFDRGQAAFDKKDYKTAVSEWQKSYQLSDEPELLYNIAQAYRLDGDCAKALAEYQKFLAADRTSSSQRPLAEQFIRELDPMCGGKSKTQSTPSVNLTRPPGPRPGRTKRIAGISVAGGGLVLIATGLYFGSRASSLGDDLTSACAQGCTWADVEGDDAAGRSAVTKQWIFLGLGSAALVTGGTIYWLGTRDGRESPVAVGPVAGGGAAISWSGSW